MLMTGFTSIASAVFLLFVVIGNSLFEPLQSLTVPTILSFGSFLFSLIVSGTVYSLSKNIKTREIKWISACVLLFGVTLYLCGVAMMVWQMKNLCDVYGINKKYIIVPPCIIGGLMIYTIGVLVCDYVFTSRE